MRQKPDAFSASGFYIMEATGRAILILLGDLTSKYHMLLCKLTKYGVLPLNFHTNIKNNCCQH